MKSLLRRLFGRTTSPDPTGDVVYESIRDPLTRAGVAEVVHEYHAIAQYPASISESRRERLLKDLREARFSDVVGIYNTTMTEDIYIVYLVRDDSGYHIVTTLDPFELYFDPMLIDSFAPQDVSELLDLVHTGACRKRAHTEHRN